MNRAERSTANRVQLAFFGKLRFQSMNFFFLRRLFSSHGKYSLMKRNRVKERDKRRSSTITFQ